VSAPQDTPMSENDPMNLTAAELRAEYSKALAMVHELATARAAEATQHRARLAAVEAERDAKSRLIAELEGEAKDLKYHPISGIYAIEAERDRLKAAAQAVLDNGTCADPDCCKAAIKHEAALVELRATLSGEGTAK